MYKRYIKHLKIFSVHLVNRKRYQRKHVPHVLHALQHVPHASRALQHVPHVLHVLEHVPHVLHALLQDETEI